MEGAVSFAIAGKELDPFTDYRIVPYSHTLHQQNVRILRLDASLLLKKNSDKLQSFVEKNARTLRQSLIYVDAVEWKYKEAGDEKEVKAALNELSYNNPFRSLGFLVGVDELPVWSLSSTDVERNFAFIYVLRKNITKKVKTVSIDYTNDYFLKHTQNVCFAIEGKDFPDEYVVLTAHYDHLGCMGDKVVFTGAHDNASGTSAVLDFARYYAENQPSRTVVFLLFTGEESGLKGSQYFVKNPLIPLDKIRFLINLDMFCGGDEGFMVVNAQSDETKPFYEDLAKINAEKQLVKEVKQRPNAANSDHYFFSKHCPAVFIYTLGGQYGGYHNYTDTCDRCGLGCYHNIFTLIREALDAIVN